MAGVDWNLVLNIAALFAIAIGALRVGTAKRLRDAATDYRIAVEAKDTRIDQLEEDVAALHARAAAAEVKAIECEKAVVKWEARYEELQRYTAQPAIEHFEKLMSEHRRQVQERHEAMIRQLGALTEGQHSNGELLLQVLAQTK